MIRAPGFFTLTSSLDISVAVLFIVFSLTALRQIGNFRLQIWQIMLGGALAVLLCGEISPANAFKAINLDVMLFLFGMFIVGEGLTRSGYLAALAGRLFERAKSVDQLVLLVIFSTGILSALLMNDTLAIMGTPLVLEFSKKYGVSAKLLLLALAFGVTTGSVMSPIGNPQNLLIAINSGLTNPFVAFFKALALPTFVNLFLVYIVLKLFFLPEFKKKSLEHQEAEILDPELARASKLALSLILLLSTLKIALVFISPSFNFRLTWIALASAVPILLCSQRQAVIKNIDWHTLVFFASMFVLMESVWESGFFQALVKVSGLDPTSLPTIFILSIGLSQLISNVPFVALFLPTIEAFGASNAQIMALAAGSTIAGNFLILGAASNVIIIQNAEKRGYNISFFEFARIGALITAINTFIYIFQLNNS